ncbi:hypothetical protein [Jannaschia faecimaris]|uniref:hypothetical protein n=1 Tax=Jannaschia faecimaris TaxID=1244108 RepID=UPI001FCE1D07|nr:hypothetical protein [Jannaschia faecimaris]
MPKSISTLFIVAALLIFWAARKNACPAQNRLESHEAEVQSDTNFTMMAAVFSIGAATVGIVLWTL